MENLPILCFKQLFNYLNIKEKVRCSLVCKKWRLAYDLLKPSDLCVYQKYFPSGKKSVLTNQTIEFKDALEADQFFKYEIVNNLFKNLKKLTIFGLQGMSDLNKYELSSMLYMLGTKNKFNYLNNFTNLLHLEICYSFEFFEKVNLEKLSLPKLKVLIFKNCYSFYSELELDCPKLEILITDMYKIKIKSHIIKFLEFIYGDFDSDIEIFKYGNKFENLETLILSDKFFKQQRKNSQFLNDLPKLKLLIVFGENEIFKRKLELHNSKNSLEVKFFDQVNEFIPIRENGVIYKNFDQPTNLNVKTFVENLSPKNFIECLTNLSKSPKIIKNSADIFFNRSLRIEGMSVNSVIDDYMILIKFFQKLRHLKYLALNNHGVFDQKFYDLLPDSLLSIQSLMIHYDDFFLNNIKLDFLFKLNSYWIVCHAPRPYDETFSNSVEMFYSFLRIFLSINKLKHLKSSFFDDHIFFTSLFKKDNFLILNYYDRSVKIIYKEIDQVLNEIDRETDKNIIEEIKSDRNREFPDFMERTKKALIQYLNNKGFKSSEFNPF